VKGMVQTLEATLAIIMIFTAIFVYSSYSQPEVDFNLSEKAYDCMLSSNDLRYNAYNNINELKSELVACLPPMVGVDVKLCSNDCSSDLPDGDVYTVSYLFSGYNSVSPRILKIWVWSEI